MPFIGEPCPMKNTGMVGVSGAESASFLMDSNDILLAAMGKKGITFRNSFLFIGTSKLQNLPTKTC